MLDLSPNKLLSNFGDSLLLHLMIGLKYQGILTHLQLSELSFLHRKMHPERLPLEQNLALVLFGKLYLKYRVTLKGLLFQRGCCHCMMQ